MKIIPLLKKILGIQTGLPKPSNYKLPDFWKLQPGHDVVFAFESDGIQYYKFANDFNIPCERAFAAITFYEEYSLRCTAEFIEISLKATETALLSNDKPTALALIQQILERKKWIIEPETVLKLASVVFFDITENCYSFNYDYAKTKIQRWQKAANKDVLGFFLQTPLADLIPSFNSGQIDLKTYSNAINKLSAKQYEKILGQLSSQTMSPELKKYCISAMETLKNSIQSEN